MDSIEDVSEEGYPVSLPSGAPYTVLARSEVAYVEDISKKYTDTFRWENISDIQDVDRIIILELLVYRWGLWLSLTKDYFGDDIDEREIRRVLKEYAGELRQLKKSLGMDKSTRDKEMGDASPAAYLDKLRQRAREFGVNRNNMMAKGIELSQQVIAMVQMYDNCDEEERVESRCRAEDICQWLLDVYIPEFQAVDKAFREGQQKYWIADQ